MAINLRFGALSDPISEQLLNQRAVMPPGIKAF